MITKVSKPFAFLVLVIILVGLACGPTVTPTQAPQQPPQQQEPSPVPQQPTEPPAQPTEPPPTEEPTQEPTEEPLPTEEPASQFFRNEFDGGIEDWTGFNIKDSAQADEGKLAISTDDGFLTFSIETMYLYAYLIYNKFTYEDVKLTVRVENRGANNNNVSLLCRYSEEDGWYEFNIANNGLYWIYAATPNPKGSGAPVYNLVANGGSNKIKMGKDVNEYTASCKGNTLSLSINGFDTKTITEKKYSLRDGKIGLSVSSFNVPSVKVEFDWLEISEP